MDIPNYKFNEVHRIFEDVLETLKAQAPKENSYDNLTKIFNMSNQKVFEKFGDLKEKLELLLKVGPSAAKGGEGWKWNSEFKL